MRQLIIVTVLALTTFSSCRKNDEITYKVSCNDCWAYYMDAAGHTISGEIVISEWTTTIDDLNFSHNYFIAAQTNLCGQNGIPADCGNADSLTFINDLVTSEIYLNGKLVKTKTQNGRWATARVEYKYEY